MFADNPGSLGPLTEAAGAALAELGSRNAIARWAGDHTLWRDEPTEIHDRLGWLTIVPEMQAHGRRVGGVDLGELIQYTRRSPR